MTSEPDSKPGRRPPTIELTATEVEKPAAGGAIIVRGCLAGRRHGQTGRYEDSRTRIPPAKAGRSFGSRLKSHAISAVIGAILMVAIAAALWIEGLDAVARQAADSVR